MNKIEKLQEKLNDACREVFENFRESGKAFDFSLEKEVSVGEVSEEHYNAIFADDDIDEIHERIVDNCAWCEDLMDSDYYSRAHCLCVGVTSNDGKVYATIYDENNGEFFEMQIWHFNADIATMVLDLMEKEVDND